MEQATGYTLEREESAGGLPGMVPNADSSLAKPLQNARNTPDGQIPPKDQETRQNASSDDLPLEEVILRAMEKAMAEELAEGGIVENSAFAEGEHPRNENGEFSSKEGDASSDVKESPKDAQKRKKAEEKAAKRVDRYRRQCEGEKNFAKVQAGEDCPNFMQTATLGPVAFNQGDKEYGYSHICAKGRNGSRSCSNVGK